MELEFRQQDWDEYKRLCARKAQRWEEALARYSTWEELMLAWAIPN